jgi:preprotein translocase subunit SecF
MSATIGAFNYSGAYDNTTSISVEYWINKDSYSTKKLADKQQMMDNFLSLIEYDGKSIGELTSEEDITLEMRMVYLNEDDVTYNIYNFEIPLSVYFDEKSDSNIFTVAGTQFQSLDRAVKEAAEQFTSDNSVYASANTVFYQAGTPNLGTVYLGLGVGIAIAFVYLLFRFGLARAFVSSVISLGSSVLVVGFFALTRIAVTPLASIGAAVAALTAIYVAIFTLNRAKEIVKDSRERDKTALEFKNACLVKANAEEAVEIIIFSSIIAALCLSLAILGPREYAFIFVGALIGIAFAVACALFVLVPCVKFLSVYIKRAGDSVSNARKKAQEERRANEKNAARRKGSEPEEAIFIGIND